jgi:hypothetical protein
MKIKLFESRNIPSMERHINDYLAPLNYQAAKEIKIVPGHDGYYIAVVILD